MRKKIVAGNWKMNLTKTQAIALAQAIDATEFSTENTEVFLFAPYVYLDVLEGENFRKIALGAQNFFPHESGAFTGEIGIAHLKDLKINAVLVGHSERRILLSESNTFLQEKVSSAIANNLQVFFCCGEPEHVRDNGQHFDFIAEQLKDSLFHLNQAEMKAVVIAYEPIWAIGSGKTASVHQANEMHQHIRKLIAERYDKATAENTRILYGGSCNAQNASDLFAMPDIDGGLIGGASLMADDFLSIINAAQ